MTITTFEHISPGTDSILEDAYVKSCLKKWGLGQCQFLTSKASAALPSHDQDHILKTFFNDAVVRQHFKVAGRSGAWQALEGTVSGVTWYPVPATLTTMKLLDRLQEPDSGTTPIVQHNGSLTKCMDDFVDGFQISDNLREMLLNPESENANLFTAAEKDQLLFRIFRHLCLGGGMCQFEDDLESYLEVTKKIYKALLRVRRVASTGELRVDSQVVGISDISSTTGTSTQKCAGAH